MLLQTIGANESNKQVTRALILIPTRELAEQVSLYLKKLLTYCEGLSIANIASGTTTHLQRYACDPYLSVFDLLLKLWVLVYAAGCPCSIMEGNVYRGSCEDTRFTELDADWLAVQRFRSSPLRDCAVREGVERRSALS